MLDVESWRGPFCCDSEATRPGAGSVCMSSAGEGTLNWQLLALGLQYPLILLIICCHHHASSPFRRLLLLDFHLTQPCFIFLNLLLKVRLTSLNTLQFDFHVAHVFFLVLVLERVILRGAGRWRSGPCSAIWLRRNRRK